LGRLASGVELAEPLGGSPKFPISPINFMLNVLLGSTTFGEKPEVAEGTR